MTRFLRHRLFCLLTSLVLGLSLTAAAFAHRAPSVSEAALSAWLISGGSLADLCGDAGHASAMGDSCPLCPPGAMAAALPAPPMPASPIGRFLAEAVPAPLSYLRPAPRGPAHGARAPPVL